MAVITTGDRLNSETTSSRVRNAHLTTNSKLTTISLARISHSRSNTINRQESSPHQSARAVTRGKRPRNPATAVLPQAFQQRNLQQAQRHNRRISQLHGTLQCRIFVQQTLVSGTR